MYFLFPNDTNTIILLILNFASLFLSFTVYHVSTRRKKEPIALSCFFSMFLAFFSIRAFLIDPNKHWMFTSSSKILLAEGFLLSLLKDRGYRSWIFGISFSVLFILSVLKVEISYYLEGISLAFFLLPLFKKNSSTFLRLSAFLFSASSILFYLSKNVYTYPVTAGNLLLALHFLKEYVDIPRKESEKLSEELGVNPEDLFETFKNIQNFFLKIPELISNTLEKNNENEVREVFERYFPKPTPSYLEPFKQAFSSFIEKYIKFLEENRKFQEVYIILVKNLAHNLKNPINAVYVNAQLLRYKYPETFEIAKNIERTCHVMLKEIDKILNISVGKTSNVRKEDLEMAISPILEIAKSKKLEVNLKMDFDEIQLDKDAFLSIVTNLFSNAVKYTPFGKVSLTIEKRNDKIILMISDTGPGLNSTSGFGLLTVSKLVNYLRGTMEIIRKNGTTFKIEIPLGGERNEHSNS
ncbi:HAMP domain-containing sensor histidine kinase [Thermotoga sp. KOL6]|uniref:ATP-binding protein n=1 Tax=Thermotoga sp. KOL6 TaxID=126741 RepID=UPI001E4F0F9C|nr:HAMP domain-containing sensor histidine kinase [Thermotoga sp. KOL6]